MMTRLIEVTREDLDTIDYDSIVAFEFAEPGAMGTPGDLFFSTADGTAFHLNYLHGEVSLREFCRAYRQGAVDTFPIPPSIWTECYLGMGNHFIVHTVALKKLLRDEGNEPEQLLTRWRESLGTPLLTKQERYHWLVEKARSSYPPEGSGAELTWCDACEDEINLWIYWQGRGCLDPEVLVVGKDWGDPKSEECAQALENIRQGRPYLENNSSPTDKNLAYLMERTFGANWADRSLFFTNMLLGYRSKGNTGTLKASSVQDKAFFKELVNILRPKAVICLGARSFETAMSAFGEPTPYRGGFRFALEHGKTVADINGIRFFGMAHCGVLGSLNRSGSSKGAGTEASLEIQVKDWERVADYLRGRQDGK